MEHVINIYLGNLIFCKVFKLARKNYSDDVHCYKTALF